MQESAVLEQLNQLEQETDLIKVLEIASEQIRYFRRAPSNSFGSIDGLFQRLFIVCKNLLILSQSNVRVETWKLLRYASISQIRCKYLCDNLIHLLVFRSLERDQRYLNERMESLKLVKQIVDMAPTDLSLGIIRSLVTVAAVQKDDFSPLALTILQTAAIANPDLVARCRGFNVLIDAVASKRFLPKREVFLGFLNLMCRPECRAFADPLMQLQTLFSPLMCRYLNYKPGKKELEQMRSQWKRACANLLLASRTWSGLLLMASNPFCLKSVLSTIRLSQHSELKMMLLQTLEDILSVHYWGGVNTKKPPCPGCGSTIGICDCNHKALSDVARKRYGCPVYLRSKCTARLDGMPEAAIENDEHSKVHKCSVFYFAVPSGALHGCETVFDENQDLFFRRRSSTGMPASAIMRSETMNSANSSKTKESSTDNQNTMDNNDNNKTGTMLIETPDLLNSYLGLVITAFCENDIMGVLAEISVNNDTEISHMARRILGSLLHISAQILSPQDAPMIGAVPNLLKAAVQLSGFGKPSNSETSFSGESNNESGKKAQADMEVIARLLADALNNPLLKGPEGALLKGQLQSVLLHIGEDRAFATSTSDNIAMSGTAWQDSIRPNLHLDPRKDETYLTIVTSRQALTELEHFSRELSKYPTPPSDTFNGSSSSHETIELIRSVSCVSTVSQTSINGYPDDDDFKSSPEMTLVAGDLPLDCLAWRRCLYKIASNDGSKPLAALLSQTKVLSAKDYEKWDWPLIHWILEIKLGKFPQLLSEVLKTKFMRRLGGFFVCNTDSSTLGRLAWNPENQIYTACMHEWLRVLLSGTSGEAFLRGNRRGKLVQSIQSSLSVEFKPKAFKDSKRVFSPKAICETLAREYLTLIGTIARSSAGLEILRFSGLDDTLLRIANNSNRDNICRVIALSLTFDQRHSFARTLLRRWMLKGSLRLRLGLCEVLRGLYRAHDQSFGEWAISLLVGQLKCEPIAQNAAMSILEECFDDPLNISIFVALEPDTSSISCKSQLLIKCASVNEGLEWLITTGWVADALNEWKTDRDDNVYIKAIEHRQSIAVSHLGSRGSQPRPLPCFQLQQAPSGFITPHLVPVYVPKLIEQSGVSTQFVNRLPWHICLRETERSVHKVHINVISEVVGHTAAYTPSATDPEIGSMIHVRAVIVDNMGIPKPYKVTTKDVFSCALFVGKNGVFDSAKCATTSPSSATPRIHYPRSRSRASSIGSRFSMGSLDDFNQQMVSWETCTPMERARIMHRALQECGNGDYKDAVTVKDSHCIWRFKVEDAERSPILWLESVEFWLDITPRRRYSGCVPHHILGSLVQTPAGIRVLNEQEGTAISIMSIIKKALTVEETTRSCEQRTALWELAHLCSTNAGLKMVERYFPEVVSRFSQVARTHGHLAVRCDAFYALSVLQQSPIAKSQLMRIGWLCNGHVTVPGPSLNFFTLPGDDTIELFEPADIKKLPLLSFSEQDTLSLLVSLQCSLNQKNAHSQLQRIQKQKPEHFESVSLFIHVTHMLTYGAMAQPVRQLLNYGLYDGFPLDKEEVWNEILRRYPSSLIRPTAAEVNKLMKRKPSFRSNDEEDSESNADISEESESDLSDDVDENCSVDGIDGFNRPRSSMQPLNIPILARNNGSPSFLVPNISQTPTNNKSSTNTTKTKKELSPLSGSTVGSSKSGSLVAINRNQSHKQPHLTASIHPRPNSSPKNASSTNSFMPQRRRRSSLRVQNNILPIEEDDMDIHEEDNDQMTTTTMTTTTQQHPQPLRPRFQSIASVVSSATSTGTVASIHSGSNDKKGTVNISNNTTTTTTTTPNRSRFQSIESAENRTPTNDSSILLNSNNSNNKNMPLRSRLVSIDSPKSMTTTSSSTSAVMMIPGMQLNRNGHITSTIIEENCGKCVQSIDESESATQDDNGNDSSTTPAPTPVLLGDVGRKRSTSTEDRKSKKLDTNEKVKRRSISTGQTPGSFLGMSVLGGMMDNNSNNVDNHDHDYVFTDNEDDVNDDDDNDDSRVSNHCSTSSSSSGIENETDEFKEDENEYSDDSSDISAVMMIADDELTTTTSITTATATTTENNLKYAKLQVPTPSLNIITKSDKCCCESAPHGGNLLSTNDGTTTPTFTEATKHNHKRSVSNDCSPRSMLLSGDDEETPKMNVIEKESSAITPCTVIEEESVSELKSPNIQPEVNEELIARMVELSLATGLSHHSTRMDM